MTTDFTPFEIIETPAGATTKRWAATPAATRQVRTFTSKAGATTFSWPDNRTPLPGASWLIPNEMGSILTDEDLSKAYAFHYPGPKDGVGAHLFAPFVIRIGEGFARLIALVTPVNDVQIILNRGRVSFWHPALAAGKSMDVEYEDITCATWREAVDHARSIYGIDSEIPDDNEFARFWRNGFYNCQLQNYADDRIRRMEPMRDYVPWIDVFGWVQYWGQMSPFKGPCCAPVAGFHERYGRHSSLAPAFGDFGFYTRQHLETSVSLMRDMRGVAEDAGATIHYADEVGKLGNPALFIGDNTFTEGLSLDVMAPALVSGYLDHSRGEPFPEFGRYFFRERPMFAGISNLPAGVDAQSRMRQYIIECFMLGMGIDGGMLWDGDIAELVRGVCAEWDRVGFWASRPQLVRRGEFIGDDGRRFRATWDSGAPLMIVESKTESRKAEI